VSDLSVKLGLDLGLASWGRRAPQAVDLIPVEDPLRPGHGSVERDDRELLLQAPVPLAGQALDVTDRLGAEA
jgi:hypothetical protein